MKRKKVSKCCGKPFTLLDQYQCTNDRDGERWGFLCSGCERSCDWKFESIGKCKDCNRELIWGKKQESSGGCRYPTCPKCGQWYGILTTL